MAGELAAGLLAHSLALLADAGHMLTDAGALGFALVGTAVAAGLILVTGWNRFDPIASVGIAFLMLWASAGLLRESGRIFLELAPQEIDPAEVGRAIIGVAGVVEAHDLHVWTVTSGF